MYTWLPYTSLHVYMAALHVLIRVHGSFIHVQSYTCVCHLRGKPYLRYKYVCGIHDDIPFHPTRACSGICITIRWGAFLREFSTAFRLFKSCEWRLDVTWSMLSRLYGLLHAHAHALVACIHAHMALALGSCVFLCMYVCMYVYASMHVPIRTYICIHVHVHIHIHMHVHLHAHIHIHTYMHTYIHTYTYIHILQGHDWHESLLPPRRRVPRPMVVARAVSACMSAASAQCFVSSVRCICACVLLCAS
jgi:hypothetical protein